MSQPIDDLDEKPKVKFEEEKSASEENYKSFEPDEKAKEQLENEIWGNETPPQYESIFEQFKNRKEKKESKSKKIATKLFHIFTGTVSTVLLLVLVLALPVAMVIIGAKFKNKCPIEPFIPIYLIVGGSFGIIKTLFSLCQRAIIGDITSENHNEDQQPIIGRLIDNILNLFLFIWFIAGNIWVYSNYKPNSIAPIRQPNNYCDPTLYFFAFWVITTSYILMALILFCICCLGFCASCTAYFITNAA